MEGLTEWTFTATLAGGLLPKDTYYVWTSVVEDNRTPLQRFTEEAWVDPE